MELNSTNVKTGRRVALASIVIGLVGAIAPVLVNMDLSSTAGVVAGLVAVSTVVVKYLDGSQRYEERLDTAALAAGPPAVGAVDPEPTGSAVPDPAPVGDVDDNDEPAEPQPGEVVLLPLQLDDEEVMDVPAPPTDDEIDELTPEMIEADVEDDSGPLALAS